MIDACEFLTVTTFGSTSASKPGFSTLAVHCLASSAALARCKFQALLRNGLPGHQLRGQFPLLPFPSILDWCWNIRLFGMSLFPYSCLIVCLSYIVFESTTCWWLGFRCAFFCKEKRPCLISRDNTVRHLVQFADEPLR